MGTNFSEILIKILTFSFKKMRLKVSSAKWRLLCLGFNVLITLLLLSVSDVSELGNVKHHDNHHYVGTRIRAIWWLQENGRPQTHACHDPRSIQIIDQSQPEIRNGWHLIWLGTEIILAMKYSIWHQYHIAFFPFIKEIEYKWWRHVFEGYLFYWPFVRGIH